MFVNIKPPTHDYQVGERVVLKEDTRKSLYRTDQANVVPAHTEVRIFALSQHAPDVVLVSEGATQDRDQAFPVNVKEIERKT